MADYESTPERDAKSPVADMELQPLTRDEKKPSPPGVPPSGTAAAAAAANDDDEDDEERAAREAAKAVFERPLVYYKRNAPYLRKRRHSRGPTEIVWPDKTISLGVPPERGVDQPEAEPNEENLVVFSSPGEEARLRRLYFGRCLFVSIIIVFILITIMFAGASDKGEVPTLTYVSSLITLVLGIISWKWHNVRLLTLFIVVTYIDAILSLLRVYGWVPLITFIAQMFVCYMANKVKQTLQPTWFTPSQ